MARDWAEGRIVVHASLPCKTWSTQAIARHRPGGVLDGPRISAEARDANAVVRHVIEELRYLKRVCPNAIITVENPATGYLQYFEPWQAAICELGLTAVDVTYCMFGAPHRKPTTIWTNAKLQYLVLHLTNRGASWASGAAQAAQVVRSIFFVCGSTSAAGVSEYR